MLLRFPGAPGNGFLRERLDSGKACVARAGCLRRDSRDGATVERGRDRRSPRQGHRGAGPGVSAIAAQPIPAPRLALVPLAGEHADEMAVVLADPELYTFTLRDETSVRPDPYSK